MNCRRVEWNKGPLSEGQQLRGCCSDLAWLGGDGTANCGLSVKLFVLPSLPLPKRAYLLPSVMDSQVSNGLIWEPAPCP